MFLLFTMFTFVVRFAHESGFATFHENGSLCSRKWLCVDIVRSSAAIFALAIFVADHLHTFGVTFAR
jgi:hypothetical protein